MRMRIWAAIFSLSLISSFLSLTYADNVPGQIMVKFQPDVIEIPEGARAAAVGAVTVKVSSIQALNTKHELAEVRQLYKDALELRPDWTHLANEYVFTFPQDRDAEGIAQEYSEDPNVISASPVSIVRAFATTPNDPYFLNGSQYGLTNINAANGWDRTTGSSDTTIAVLDTGINYNHEDLTAKINLTDAKDYANGDDDPWDDNSYRDMYHGTTVSGVIAASTNNGVGVAGVDWLAEILPIKVLDNYGNGSMADILDGITWAMAQDVDIINMSFGQYSPSLSLQQRCQEAYDQGIILVAAAGNGNVEYLNSHPSYPAGYSFVLAVAAVDEDDVRSYWGGEDPTTHEQQASNYGTWVDVCAPGTSIWTTHKNDDYKTISGTSIACPFVSGLAGLIKAVNPNLTNAQIMEKIIETTDSVDALQEDEYKGKLGSGRINLYRAVAGVVGAISTPEGGDYITENVNIYGSANGWDFSSYLLEVYRGTAFVATIESSSVSVEAGLLGTWDTQALNGSYAIKLRVFSNSLGTTEAEINVYVDNTSPVVSITYPASGATIGGELTIKGLAQDQYIDRYILKYGKGTSPSIFETIATVYASVESGILGTWETTGLDGAYTLVLTAYDKVDASGSTSLNLDIQTTTPPTKQVSQQVGLPLAYAVPNPFNRTSASQITFNYSLQGNFNATIYLFDVTGNLIWQKSYEAGENGGKAGDNNPTWSGQDLFGASVPNGVFLYQIVADQRIIARGKVIVLN